MADLTHIVLSPQTYEEALEYWRNKVALTPKEFRKLNDEAKVNAFTIAGATGLDMLLDVWRMVDRAIAQGTTLREFQEQARAIFADKGWEGPAPYRLDNVFRTNIQTAYQVGRYRQQTSREVLEATPNWMYSAVHDNRTRPSHMAMDGIVRRADDPFWNEWYPPNGYRCRCTVRNLSDDDVRARGLTVGAGIPDLTIRPDPGFAVNPGKQAWQPDLERYPPAFRAAYRKRLE